MRDRLSSRGPSCETLEPRRLLSTVVFGTASADVIEVRTDPAGIIVRVNGVDEPTIPTGTGVEIASLAGDDVVTIDSSVSTLSGGGGNDVFWGGFGADAFGGGAGVDAVGYDRDGRAAGVTVTLDGAANDGAANDGAAGEGDNVGNDVDGAYGTAYAHTLSAAGRAGGVRLQGDAGDDTITGGAGADHVNGGGGNDVLYVRDSMLDYVDGGAGTNSAQIDNGVNDLLNIQSFIA